MENDVFTILIRSLIDLCSMT